MNATKIDYERVRKQYFDAGISLQKYMYECSLSGVFPINSFQTLASNGFFEATVKYGLRWGHYYQASALEGFAEGSHDGGFCISAIVHGSMGVPLINYYASLKAQTKYLNKVITGENIISFCSTELETGGTDAYNPRCILEKRSGKHYLRGEKWNITNAPNADIFIVWCKESDTNTLIAVIAERGFIGVDANHKISLGCVKTSPVGAVKFDNVRIPSENIIRVKKGAKALTDLLTGERILSAFAPNGLIKLMTQKCVKFANERVVNGTAISKHQHVQSRIVEMEKKGLTTKAMCHWVLGKYIDKSESLSEVSTLKTFAMQNAEACASEAERVFGCLGLLESAQFGPIKSDAAAARIGGGTEEAHALIIWSDISKRYRNFNRSLFVEEPIETLNKKKIGCAAL